MSTIDEIVTENMTLRHENERLKIHLAALAAGHLAGYDRALERLQLERDEARAERDEAAQAAGHLASFLGELGILGMVLPPVLDVNEDEQKELLKELPAVWQEWPTEKSCRVNVVVGIRQNLEHYQMFTISGQFPGDETQARVTFETLIMAAMTGAPMLGELRQAGLAVSDKTLQHAIQAIAQNWHLADSDRRRGELLDTSFNDFIWPEIAGGGLSRTEARQAWGKTVRRSFQAVQYRQNQGIRG